jgi:hypothetical protein
MLSIILASSLTQAEAMETLIKSFEADIQKALWIAVKLPDDEVKMELIKVNNTIQF